MINVYDKAVKGRVGRWHSKFARCHKISSFFWGLPLGEINHIYGISFYFNRSSDGNKKLSATPSKILLEVKWSWIFVLCYKCSCIFVQPKILNAEKLYEQTSCEVQYTFTFNLIYYMYWCNKTVDGRMPACW